MIIGDDMSKRYYFNNTDIFSIIDELYPMSINNSLDHNSFNNDNLNRLVDRIEDILEDVKIQDIEEDKKNLEDMEFLSSQANDKLKEIFANPDNLVFGNGGMADVILDTNHFYCRFPNLDSHFLPLSWNSDLEKLNNWPHNNAGKILLLVLNKRENNPIFKDIDSSNPDSNFRYEIPIEYFAGYYDRDRQEFIPNEKFLLEHDYDEYYPIYHNPVPSILLNEPDIIQEFYYTMREFAYALANTSEGLSKKGYEGICNQYLTMIKKLRELQLQITPEFLSRLQNDTIDDTLKLLDELDDTLDKEIGYDDSGWENDWVQEDTSPKL